MARLGYGYTDRLRVIARVQLLVYPNESEL